MPDIKRMSMSSSPADPRRHAVPGPSGVKYATEARGGVDHQASSCGNTTGGQHVNNFRLSKEHLLGTWNVRGMLKPGKLSIVEKELEYYNISILGLSETHMKGSGHFSTPTGNTMYFSGTEDESVNGVGILVPKAINKFVTGYNTVSDRIITLRLNTKPIPLNIIQVYAPTAQSSQEAIDQFYERLEASLLAISKRELIFIMGDCNAKVGTTLNDDHIRNVVGKYGLGNRNERGERLIDFCITHNLSIQNTRFKQHPRRLYTWISPGDRCRNQIDYIISSARWNTSIHKVKTFPGADCGSDHNLLVAWVKLRLRCPQKPVARATRIKESSKATEFSVKVNQQLIKTPLTAETSEDRWNHLKYSIINTFKEMEITHSKKSRKIWIKKDTWELIQRRKELKTRGHNKDDTEYKRIDGDVQRHCRRDKNQHLADICLEIQTHADKAQTGDLFKKVRLITRKFKAKTWVIEDSNGNPLSELSDVAERWRQYCEDLYQDSNQSTLPLQAGYANEMEPPILYEEMLQAIKSIKDGKAPGIDQITSEIIKSLGGDALRLLHELCNQIWSTCEWPSDWTQAIILPLHKKGSTKVCDNYRTISLISHSSKILLYVVDRRLRYYLDMQIPQEQAGFVKGKGTREQILNVRQIIESSHEFNKPVVMCFVDYRKAFDCVVWNSLWRVLSEMGVPSHLITLTKRLYENSRGVVRVEDVMSNHFGFQKGVRQGCILSPVLFNIYGEYILRKALEGWEGGVSIGGIKLSNLRYADDTTLFAESAEEMEELLNRVEIVSNELGLAINRNKTKVMFIDRTGQLDQNGALINIEKVKEFNYLGSLITSNASCEPEIRRRIAMAKNAMSQLQKVWKDRNIRRKTKISLVRTLIFSIFLYGSETWTIKAADMDRINAFEMWCWRRMLLIPWTAYRTNDSILEELKIKERLSTTVLNRMVRYFGHILRRPSDTLERVIISGKRPGKRPRGRRPKRWTDLILQALGLSFQEATRLAQDRDKWRQAGKRIDASRSSALRDRL